jgi:uncharacterized membrane protein (UPF0136 family)
MNYGSVVIGIYALVVFIGGVTGFIIAHSHPSLIAGVIFSALLALCSYGISKGSVLGLYGAIGLTAVLFLFFGGRYYSTHAMLPAGAMTLISGGVLIFLFGLYRGLNK